MNVLHTVASLNKSSGGPSRTVTSLCNALGQKDIDVSLLTVESKNMEDCISPDVDVVNFVTARKDKFFDPFSSNFKNVALEVCRFKNVSLIHDHGLWLPSNIASAAVAKKLHLPYVVSPRGMLEPWAIKHRQFKKTIAWRVYQKKILAQAKAFIATSEMEARNIRSLGFRQPIAIIANGVNCPDIEQLPPIDKRTEKTALFLSRIHPKKGVCELVRAWGKVKPKGWKLIIAGPDDAGHLAEVKRVIEECHVGNCISIVGPVYGEEKWVLYRRSDLFILPTYSENFGVVVAEALSVGTPVITTKGAPWQSLIDNNCGWWIQIGSEHLEKTLKYATTMSRADLKEMGKFGREFVEREFSWDIIADNTKRFYEWVLGSGTKPDLVY